MSLLAGLCLWAGCEQPAIAPAESPLPAAAAVGDRFSYDAAAALVSGAVVATASPGYEGDGYVDFQHASGDFVEWSFYIRADAPFTLRFRYANGSTATRPLTLTIQPEGITRTLSSPPTGSWSAWAEEVVAVNLIQGEHSVRITTSGSNGANFDELIVQEEAPADNVEFLKQPYDRTVKAIESPTFHAQAAGSGPVSYQWSMREGATGAWAPIQGATSAHYTLSNLTPGHMSKQLQVRAQSGNASLLSRIALPLSEPTQWMFNDVGAIGIPGGRLTTQPPGAHERIVLEGAGTSVNSSGSGSFAFVNRPFDKDLAVQARFLSFNGQGPGAMACMVIRESLAPAAQSAAFCVGPDGKARMFYNHTGGGPITSGPDIGPMPVWLRLVKRGNDFEGLYSRDGASWSGFDHEPVPWTASTHYYGVGVTSGNPSDMAALTMEGAGIVSLAPVITALNAPDVVEGSAATFSVTASANGASIRYQWRTNDEDIPGQTSSSYTTPPTTLSMDGRQFCVYVDNPHGFAYQCGTLRVRPASPWTGADIGAVGLAGSHSVTGTDATVRGSGADIFGTADAFRFVYLPLSGDGSVVARVATLENTNTWAKAGVMIRETLAAGSKHALVARRPDGLIAFQRRAATGGTSTSTTSVTGAGHLLRLTRAGSLFTAAYSTNNGTSWTTIGTQTIAMAAQVLAGLAVTSHDNAKLCAAGFTSVAVTAAPPPAWTKTDIGAVSPAGTSTVAGTAGSVEGAGADIWGTADAFTFAHQGITGDGSITVRVTGVENTNAWAKAGVMIRETTAANARNAFVLLRPAGGTAFQRRTATGGTSASTSGTGAMPYWLRLTRAGSTFTAATSQDGAAWTTLGTATITMGASVRAGLAVTSHSNGTLCTGSFDNIRIVD